MSNFIQITPFMHVEDLEKALTFFNDILGFETQFRVHDYAYVHRETVGFRILQQKGADAAPPGTRRFAYYIDVRDVDQLYAELKPKLDTLPWGEPLRWHSFFGHSFRFRKSVLVSPSRRRGLGKGTAFESPSPAVL